MIALDDLGDGFITFPDFQRALIAYERGLAKPSPQFVPPAFVPPAFDVNRFVPIDFSTFPANTWPNKYRGWDHRCGQCGHVYTTESVAGGEHRCGAGHGRIV